jgi:putative transposase
VDEKNELISYGLRQRVKYCRLVRRKINRKNRFYVQLILEGKSYQDPEKEFGKEELGMDIGPSTYAVVGNTKAELKQFCEELIPEMEREEKTSEETG